MWALWFLERLFARDGGKFDSGVYIFYKVLFVYINPGIGDSITSSKFKKVAKVLIPPDPQQTIQHGECPHLRCDLSHICHTGIPDNLNQGFQRLIVEPGAKSAPRQEIIALAPFNSQTFV